MASLNLKPYGINFVLRPGVNEISDIHPNNLEIGVKSMYNEYFIVGNVKYKTIKQLGAGTYGTTYSVTGHGGKPYAIKYIKSVRSDEDIHNLLKESIQQIIIANETKKAENGPYAPNLYKIGYDSYHGDAFIVSELMDNTVWNLISSKTPEDNDKLVPYILTNTSIELIFLQNHLKFNHRDLKTDNLMYKINPDGSINIKFIDFGFTCLTWHGMFISGGNYFRHSPKCYRETRDVSQLITSILWFHESYLSTKLKKRLQTIVKTQHDTKTQTLTGYMRKWTNSYKLLDNNNYVVEYGKPMQVFEEMIGFISGKPFKGSQRFTRKSPKKSAAPAPLAAAPGDVCPPEKILNPISRRCVLRSGAIGRKLEKEQAAPPAPPAPPATAPAPAPATPAAADDDCPPGKIRNPKTRRCVKRDGAIGRKIV